MVAGYGRYRRAPCEVGRQGPEKFEYCGTAETCVKGSKVSQTIINGPLFIFTDIFNRNIYLHTQLLLG